MPKRTPNKAIHTYIKKSVQKELPNFYSTELQKSMDQTMNQLLRRALGARELYVMKKKNYVPLTEEALLAIYRQQNKASFRYDLYTITGKQKKRYRCLDNFVNVSIYSQLKLKIKAEELPEEYGVFRENIYDSMLSRLADLLTDHFFAKTSQDDCLFLMTVNPNYEQFTVVKNARALLDHIPDDYTLLYPAARAMSRHFILHVGMTNTGKTYEAVEEMMHAASGVYLAPLRLLALETQEKLLQAGVECSMLTGEEADIREGCAHMSSTVEMLDVSHEYKVCVIDEAQMIEDPARGWAWTRAILGCLSKRIHVCMAPDALDIIKQIVYACGDTYEIVNHKREIPLVFEREAFSYPDSVRPHDALITFSRKAVLQTAAELESEGYRPSVIYGALPYSVRKEEMRKFYDGETDLVVATDAIGMGINLPIERIVFLQDEKYDGVISRKLKGQEIKQIAGRAGRKGMYEKGYVNALEDSEYLRRQLYAPQRKIAYACIQMPDTLLQLDMKLSETMERWAKIEDQGMFKKADMTENLIKCRFLEANCPQFTKEAMWDLICIPSELKTGIYKVWTHLCTMLYEGIEIEPFLNYDLLSGDGLDTLEYNYKVLDLYFAFARKTKCTSPEFFHQIVEEKEACSLGIIDRLKYSKQDSRKRCTVCRKILPAMYPYRMCEDCRNRQRARRERRAESRQMTKR